MVFRARESVGGGAVVHAIAGQDVGERASIPDRRSSGRSTEASTESAFPAIALPELPADEIEWMLGPVPPAAPMPPDEMIVELAIDALAYRLIVVESFDALRQLTIERDRAREECVRLREAARR